MMTWWLAGWMAVVDVHGGDSEEERKGKTRCHCGELTLGRRQQSQIQTQPVRATAWLTLAYVG